MSATPDRQPDVIVDAVTTGHPLITIERSDGLDVDVTSAERWENPDGSVFALVTWDEWPHDAPGQEPTL